MDEVEIVATFDSEETARDVAIAVNVWFGWIFEGDPDEPPELLEDFGVSGEDFTLDASEFEWSDPPQITTRGNRIILLMETPDAVSTVQELLEALGAYDVDQPGEDD